MADLVQHAAHRGRVDQLRDVAHAQQAQATQRLALIVAVADGAADLSHHERLGGLDLASSLARSSGARSERSPSSVARITLWGLVEPRPLVRMSFTPAASHSARTAPPAITPVPFDAGRSST